MRQIKSLLVIIGVLVIGLGGLFLYRSTSFRLVSAEPKKTGGVNAPVVFNFNKKLSEKTLKEFEISPYTAGRTLLKGNSLIFEPSEKYHIGQVYTAKIKAVFADSGKTLGEVKVSFKAELLDFNKLTNTDREKQISETDGLERTNPFLAILPEETLEYKIDYDIEAASDSQEKVPLVITLYAVLNDADQLNDYKMQREEYKQKALQWIKDQGEDPTKYKITYEPED